MLGTCILSQVPLTHFTGSQHISIGALHEHHHNFAELGIRTLGYQEGRGNVRCQGLFKLLDMDFHTARVDDIIDAAQYLEMLVARRHFHHVMGDEALGTQVRSIDDKTVVGGC